MAWVYVMSHSDTDGYYKVGFTDRTPEERLKEIKSTGLPIGYYKIDYAIELEKGKWASKVESEAHKILSRYREQGEWFCPYRGLDEIIEAIDKAYERLEQNEKDKNEEYLRLKKLSETERVRILREKEIKKQEYFLKKNELVQKYNNDKKFIEDTYQRAISGKYKKQSYWDTFPVVVIVVAILFGQKNGIVSAILMGLFFGVILNYFFWALLNKDPRNGPEYKRYRNDLECLKKSHDRELLSLESKYKS